MDASLAISSLIPYRCAGCRERGSPLCDVCRFAIASSPSVIVPASPAGVVTTALTFDGVARSAILGLKYRNGRAAARVLAGVLVRRLGLASVNRPPFDLVTWAPTSRRRSAERGYDQAELLARAVAAHLGVPCRRLLYRTHGDAQTGRGRDERLTGPGFRARPARIPIRVLVVDDVVTTGATLGAAGQALLDAGIAEVRLVALAATPAPRRSHAKARERPPGRLESA
jgi:predicted amidophosphoribosyltransferase